MSKAFYMVFAPALDTASSGDRIGGVPTLLPPAVPQCPTFGGKMAFLAQFHRASGRLEIPELPGLVCIQLYQSREVDDGADPSVRVVGVFEGALVNTNRDHRSERHVVPHTVDWIPREDPESHPLGDAHEGHDLFASKAGGLEHFKEIHDFPPDARILLHLKEMPGNFNFAGRNAVVYVLPDGTLGAELT